MTVEELKKAILKTLRGKSLGATKIADAVGDSRPRVSRALAALVESGELAKVGNTRATVYSHA